MSDKTFKTLSRDEELKKEGWIRNSLLDEPRLSEVVKLHKELGFEVHLEPAYPLVCKEQSCTSCFQEKSDTCKIVYIRKSGPGSSESDSQDKE